MRRFSFSVDGMACRRCVREVTALLRDVPGVETVIADGGRSLVTVTGSMSLGDLLHGLSSSGHSVRLVDADDGDH